MTLTSLSRQSASVGGPSKGIDEHSLCYLYTVQSKSSSDRVSEFSAVTLLDDRQIDSYSSTDGVRTPKQDWMKEMKESEWTAGADQLKYDGQQLNKILNIQMKAFRHDESDGHTLQWRVGCEVEKHSGGSLSVLNCTSEYGYDGQNLISYNWTSRRWSASVSQSKVLEEEWNAGPVDQRCEDCVHWMKTYLKYSTTDTKLTPPDVHVFVKKPVTDSTKLTLTCLATGFYPKDVKMSVRKFTTSLPEHLLTSSGVRPNDDGTYQLRKSVEIQEDETADYNCYTNHSSITEPVIKQWERSHSQGGLGLAVGGAVAGVILTVLVGVVIFILRKTQKAGEYKLFMFCRF
ncbi:H-2 class I histocompatibility antigen, alpha chain-like [Colossoma macropomum]|uniref:H-2 class I histocompatibility antigen, alpha chain-like n=1 Tax=Colossoma macropomum TaxID=42526 RepID=UPI0018649D79|nr:H-2 class I histocompatibility antigen, alpha chain-like [Colossoma macropomum]